jgi:hypothetical protein
VVVEATLADLRLRDLGVIVFFDDTPQAEPGTAPPSSVAKATAPAPVQERGLRIKM